MASSIRSTHNTSSGGVHYQLDEAVELKGREAVEPNDGVLLGLSRKGFVYFHSNILMYNFIKQSQFQLW